ncbi:MAG: SMP-30/gluconolactonase/LRE family protein [Treponema sp.]|nr:SMP-30/gluconolactonase/LRE family protein [Treponema sp.]
MTLYTAKVFSQEKYQLGESPFYDARTGLLSWVDITQGKFFTQADDGSRREFDIGQALGAALPAQKAGTYVICGTDGLYLLDTLAEKPCLKLVQNLTSYFESFQRCNDAKSDPVGRLWFGSSVNDDHEACGNLYCMDTLDGGKITVRQAETKISNGLAWSRDHKKFYFSDSLEHAVFSYDYDEESSQILNRQVLFTVDGPCVSDGMCIDDQDNLWVAFWGGHRIEQRSTKDGSLLAKIDVDAENVTSCCFMGKEMNTLFITTSGNGLNGQNDGRLFTCKVDAKGPDCDFCKL